ncbi:SDR family NAD(P)-dependent oxidoreductase [Pseudonocardia sp. Cha107L01]|uniref:SDR family NAD(P)-dependent oxidoreductase n=1 Tax=Pseudonocardia sp. Cha107L01 TaxID=3457576 RepID=UPI00403E4E81
MTPLRDGMREVAVVAGGANEIGLAIGRQLVKRGHSVVLVDLDEVALEHAEQELKSIGGQVMTLAGDVADADIMAALGNEVTQSFGPPEVVCATTEVMGPVSELWELPPTGWENTFRSNVGAVLSLIRTFAPQMRAAEGDRHFVIIGSSAGFLPMPYMSVYHATMHALLAISQGLELELEQEAANVQVHLVSPGAVKPPQLLAVSSSPLGSSTAEDNARAAQLLAKYREWGDSQPAREVAQAVSEALDSGEFHTFADVRLPELIRGQYEAVARGDRPRAPSWA